MNEAKQSVIKRIWRSAADAGQSEGRAAKPGIADVAEMVKAYARQELVGPLKGAGRWIGMGLAGSSLLLIGGLFLIVGALRVLQEETGSALTGNLSWVPYVVVAVALTAVLAALVQQLTKRSL